MNFWKRIVIYTTTLAMLGSSTMLQAQNNCYNTGGCGYQESRSSALVPAVVLGALVIIGIVAVIVQNSTHHSHAHCD